MSTPISLNDKAAQKHLRDTIARVDPSGLEIAQHARLSPVSHLLEKGFPLWSGDPYKFLYTWRVEFKDGDTLWQFDYDGSEREFPREKISTPGEVVQVAWDPIYRKDRGVQYNVPPHAIGVFFRRCSVSTAGATVYTYALGSKWTDEPVEGLTVKDDDPQHMNYDLIFISPRMRVNLYVGFDEELGKPIGSVREFPGSIERTSNFDFQPALFRWAGELNRITVP